MQAQDIKTFEKAYKEYYSLLCSFSMRYINDSIIVEGIVDEVFFNIWKHRDEIEITSMKSYLLKSVRNRCLNELKSAKNKFESPFSSLGVEDCTGFIDSLYSEPTHPLDELLDKELEMNVTNAVGKLPKECKRVFEMSRFEHKKYEAIAGELNISINTVKYHMKNALKHLSETLGKYR